MKSELARRIVFTLGALLIYRLGTYIPLPGIGGSGPQVTVVAGNRFSIFSLSILPYLSAAILIQLLSIVCILPELLISQYNVPFYFGGTSLLIVVSVTMDTVAQVQGYLLAHQYEGLIRKSKLRGRRR